MVLCRRVVWRFSKILITFASGNIVLEFHSELLCLLCAFHLAVYFQGLLSQMTRVLQPWLVFCLVVFRALSSDSLMFGSLSCTYTSGSYTQKANRLFEGEYTRDGEFYTGVRGAGFEKARRRGLYGG